EPPRHPLARVPVGEQSTGAGAGRRPPRDELRRGPAVAAPAAGGGERLGARVRGHGRREGARAAGQGVRGHLLRVGQVRHLVACGPAGRGRRARPVGVVEPGQQACEGVLLAGQVGKFLHYPSAAGPTTATVPAVPSTASRLPAASRASAGRPTFVTQGTPSSRATIAAWQSIPPAAVTRAEASAISGTQSGSVCSASSTAPGFHRSSPVSRGHTPSPVACPADAAMPRTTCAGA